MKKDKKKSNNFKTKFIFWNLRKFYHKKFKLQDGKEISLKIRKLIFSIFVAFLIIISILWMTIDGNPFQAFDQSFQQLLNSVSTRNRLFEYVSIFTISGLSIAIAFKTGMFNLGVSGQMIMGSLLAGMLALYAGNSIPYGVGQIVVLLVSMISGALFALIAGSMKTYFNVNEVVSTLLLNWVAFFVNKSILESQDFNKYLSEINDSRTMDFSNNYTFRLQDSTFYPSLIIIFSFSIFTWFIFRKTTLGFKMIMVGKNRDAAIHAGINVKRISLFSMAYSGAIAGVLGIAVNFMADINLSRSLIDAIPSYGFDGIVIAILAFNNPLAIIPIAFMFGFLKQLIASTNIIDNKFIDLSFGILMFISAINVIFESVKFKKYFIKIFKGRNEWYFEKTKQILINKNNIIWYDKYENEKIKISQLKSKLKNYEKKEKLKKTDILLEKIKTLKFEIEETEKSNQKSLEMIIFNHFKSIKYIDKNFIKIKKSLIDKYKINKNENNKEFKLEINRISDGIIKEIKTW